MLYVSFDTEAGISKVQPIVPGLSMIMVNESTLTPRASTPPSCDVNTEVYKINTSFSPNSGLDEKIPQLLVKGNLNLIQSNIGRCP